MTSQRAIETGVGLFILAAIAALLILAFRVSGLTGFVQQDSYLVTAAFDDIGQLKVRSAVKIDGVNIGEVSDIHLDPVSFRAIVSLRINASLQKIPDDSSAAILTAGLLGDNYVAISPMYSANFLKNGDQIKETHSAMILEKLIGQFLFSLQGSHKQGSQKTTSTGKSS